MDVQVKYSLIQLYLLLQLEVFVAVPACIYHVCFFSAALHSVFAASS